MTHVIVEGAFKRKEGWSLLAWKDSRSSESTNTPPGRIAKLFPWSLGALRARALKPPVRTHEPRKGSLRSADSGPRAR